jgi:predicted O-methyltransferase YrrM
MQLPKGARMTEAQWQAVDAYLTQTLVRPDAALDAALAQSTAHGLPAISVSAPLGKTLHLLATMLGAKRVLEIGTLGGYSTIWLARALAAGGTVVTLEIDPRHAAVARDNFARAGVTHLVDLRVGPALDALPAIAEETRGAGKFDLVFIDADKPNNPSYFTWALQMTRIGGIIVVDNVVRKGEVANAASTDASVQGTRKVLDMIAAEPRVTATALQTVGSKGYDGFAVVLVKS